MPTFRNTVYSIFINFRRRGITQKEAYSIAFAMGETDISELLEEVQFKSAVTFGMTADADMAFWTEVNKYHINFGGRFRDILYKTEYSEGETRKGSDEFKKSKEVHNTTKSELK
jgi:hypothetical protein